MIGVLRTPKAPTFPKPPNWHPIKLPFNGPIIEYDPAAHMWWVVKKMGRSGWLFDRIQPFHYCH